MKKTHQIMCRALAWSCMAIATLLVPLPASAQTLVHRYSFNGTGSPTNIIDSIGGPAWDGTILTGGTNALAGPGGSFFYNGQLYLTAAAEDYVQLPPGILSNYTAVTLDTWVTFGTLPGACFLWGFGDTETNPASSDYGAGYNYIFCQPSQGRIAITAANPGYTGEQNANSTSSFYNANGTEVHVTAVFDPPAGYEALYTNGVLAAENDGVTVQMNQISNVVNYLARSLYYPDGYYDSEWDEFRIWDGALNPLQVAACDVNGPNNTNDNNYGTLTSLQLNVTQYQMTEGTHQAATVTATTSVVPYPVNISRMASYSSSDTNVLMVTNGVITAVGQGQADIVASFGGLSSTQIITAVAGTAPVLMHRYSFTSGASDSVGGAPWTGTLNGNASISGGQLVIPNATNTAPATDYLQLPPGILTNSTDGIGPNFNDPAVTVEAWATIAPSQWTWANLFDFGVQDSVDNDAYSISFDVHSGGTASTIASISDTDNANGNRQNLTMQPPLDGHTNVFVAVVFNPPAGYMAVYTNGVLMGKNTSVTISMAGIQGLTNKIGADNWPDPGMKGSVDEFRIWNGALSSQEIAISAAAGPNSIPTTVTNGPGSLLSLTLQAPSTLEAPKTAQLQLLANYTYLTNWDLLGNSIFPVTGLTVSSSDTNVVWLDSNYVIHSKYPGVATITVVYQGTTNTATITVTEPPATPTLVHRYSFNDANGSTTVADSVGGPTWDGTVMSGGTNGVPTPGDFTNGVLYLSSAVKNYVELPGGILSNYTAVTIETWANMTSFPVNSYLWSFGDTDVANTNTYSGGLPSGYDLIFCAPQAGNLTISDADPSWQGGMGLNDQNWNGRTDFHLTAVFDPPAHYMAIYTNGVLAAINNNETIPMSSVSNVFSYIGRSLYYADPFPSFSIDEFRIYDGVMTPADVAASQLLGPGQVLTTNAVLSAASSAGHVTFSWPAAASGFTLQSRTSLTTGSWTTVPTGANLVGNQWQAVVPQTSGTEFFRLVR